MNKYTHLSDQDRKDVELSLSSSHDSVLIKLGSELRTANVECDNAQGMLKDVVKKI